MNCLLCKGEVNPPEYEEPENIYHRGWMGPNPKYNGKLTHAYYWCGEPVCRRCEDEIKPHRKPLPHKKSKTELAHDRSFAKFLKGSKDTIKLHFDPNEIHPGTTEHKQQKKIATMIRNGILTNWETIT